MPSVTLPTSEGGSTHCSNTDIEWGKLKGNNTVQIGSKQLHGNKEEHNRRWKCCQIWDKLTFLLWPKWMKKTIFNLVIIKCKTRQSVIFLAWLTHNFCVWFSWHLLSNCTEGGGVWSRVWSQVITRRMCFLSNDIWIQHCLINSHVFSQYRFLKTEYKDSPMG